MTDGAAPPRRLRVAHCSDIHLDGGHAHVSYFRDGFVRVLAAAREEGPDLLLIAGDLFDANDASDDTVRWAMDALGAQPYPVVMIPGNHDCLFGDALFTRYDFDAIHNVQMLTAPDGEVRVLDELDVAVWGKGMPDHTPCYRPIANCPSRPEGVSWYLGLGHGIHVPQGTSTDRSSPIHHDEIADSPCDYLALGHHHAALEVHAGDTAAAYSGSPTDTVGLGATYAVVDLEANRPPVVSIRVLPPPR